MQGSDVLGFVAPLLYLNIKEDVEIEPGKGALPGSILTECLHTTPGNCYLDAFRCLLD